MLGLTWFNFIGVPQMKMAAHPFSNGSQLWVNGFLVIFISYRYFRQTGAKLTACISSKSRKRYRQ
jgi:hypothetical protein